MFQAPFIQEDQSSQRAVQILQDTFIAKTTRIQITDGRTFEGVFVCVDNEINVILQGAYEYRLSEQEKQKRWAGMVMIPGNHITNVEVKQPSNNGGIYG